MNSKSLALTALVAGLLVPAAALAQPVFADLSLPSARIALVDRLQQQEQSDESQAKFWSQEPVTQQDYYVQETKDRELIARISAGEPVSRDELAEALERVDTEY
jgi:hypothetical protein